MCKQTISIKNLAVEIKTASDDYIAMRISEKEFEELMFHIAFRYGNNIFTYNGSLKPTIQSHLGCRRCYLVQRTLDKLNVPMF